MSTFFHITQLICIIKFCGISPEKTKLVCLFIKHFFLRFVIKASGRPDQKWKMHTKFGKAKAKINESFRDLIDPYIR